MFVLAYVTDLALQAEFTQNAHAAETPLRIVSSVYHFLPALGEGPALVLVDLNASGISAATLIGQVKVRDSAPITIAFADEGQDDLQDQARNAGADRVMTTKALSGELGAILRELRDGT